MADFDSWSKESLVLFAHDASVRMDDQKREIEMLRDDLKASMDAYRDLVRMLKPVPTS